MVTRPTHRHWKSVAPAPPKNSKTFAGQAALPSMPVPDLDYSLDRLRTSLQPFARSQAELQALESKIRELKSTGFGSNLQQRLLQRKVEKDKVGSNWLEEWWDDDEFLTYRGSLLIDVSYYFGFTPHPPHLPQTPVHRAAALTRSAMLFRQRLKRGEIVPDATKQGPICMDAYQWLFDCCRIPSTDGKDFCVSYAQAGDTGDSGHIVVMRNGRLWKVDAGLLSTNELEKQFQFVYDNSKGNAPGVGILTSNTRDAWAKDYQALRDMPSNAPILDAIESCAFIVCLDQGRPQGVVELSRATWHGGVAGEELGNRWLDKPCQFIVFDNGAAGFMGEHAVIDGTQITCFCNEVVDALHSLSFPHSSPATPVSTPTPLDFTLTPRLCTSMKAAQRLGLDLVNSSALEYLTVPYGRDAIKAFGVSPDTWAQFIIQLAFWRLSQTGLIPGVGAKGRGELVGTTEPAMTRKFRKGRSETVRIVSNEVKAFCQAMDSSNVSVQNKVALIRAAAREQTRRARETCNGMGIDWHMRGLKHLVKADEGETMPALFLDPLYQRASDWKVLTGTIFSKHFPAYGWGEIVQDAFSVPYMTGYDDRMQFTITARSWMPVAEFKNEIERAARDLYALFCEAGITTKAKL